MDENEQQDKEQQEQSIGSQMASNVANTAKQRAEQAAKKKVEQAAKKAQAAMAKKLAQSKIIAALASAAVPIAIIFVICLLVGIVFAILHYAGQKQASDEISAAVTNMKMQYCTIDDKGIHFDKEALKANINSYLNSQGMDLSSIYLGSTQPGLDGLSQADRYIYDMMTASMASEFPYIPGSDSEAQGIIKIKRKTDADANAEDLTYIGYEKLQAMITSEDKKDKKKSLKYFSLDENWNLCITKETIDTQTIEHYKDEEQTSKQVNEDYQVIEVKIPYQIMVAQYGMPMEFLFNLLLIGQNPNYTQAVVELVRDMSEIELTIFDSTTTVTNIKTYTYTGHRRWEETVSGDPSSDDPKKQVDHKSTHSSEHKYKTVTTIETVENSIKANVTKVKGWFLKQETAYIGEVLPTQEALNQSQDLGSDPEPSGVGEWNTDKNETIVETVDTTQWRKETDTVGEIYPDLFLGLWKNAIGSYIPGLTYEPNGREVKYIDVNNITFSKPVGNFLSGEEYLYQILYDNSITQTHAEIMKYMFHYYRTGEKLDNIDVNFFSPQEFQEGMMGTGNVHNTRYTLEQFVEIVNNYVPSNGSGYAGSHQEGYNKYFKPYAEDFYNIAVSYNLNPEFIFCIGIHESAYGTSRIINDKNNAFGYGAVDGNAYNAAWTFESMKEGIEQECNDLSTKFLNPSHWKYQRIASNGYNPDTIDGIGSLYASDGSWARNVQNYMVEIFGYTSNPDDIFSSTPVGNATMQKVVDLALSKVGNPYVWGATGPNAFDCSGLMQWAYREGAGINLPRTSSQMAVALKNKEITPFSKYDCSALQPGDILWRSGHVGMYIGDGKCVEAKGAKWGIVISNVSSKSFTNAFRVIM